MVQKIYSKIHPVLCTNTHHDVIDLVNHEMVKNTKTWISWKRNIIFLRDKKILNLYLRWHILKSYRFLAGVTADRRQTESLKSMCEEVPFSTILKPGSLQHVINEVFYEDSSNVSNQFFSYLLQSQYKYFTEHSPLLLIKSGERLMANINQKKISNIKVKRQCFHDVFVPL